MRSITVLRLKSLFADQAGKAALAEEVSNIRSERRAESENSQFDFRVNYIAQRVDMNVTDLQNGFRTHKEKLGDVYNRLSHQREIWGWSIAGMIIFGSSVAGAIIGSNPQASGFAVVLTGLSLCGFFNSRSKIQNIRSEISNHMGSAENAAVAAPLPLHS